MSQKQQIQQQQRKIDNNASNKNDSDLGFENLDDFDMFDITTGNIISYDNSPPRYDTSIRWDSSVNAKLEKSVHEYDNRFKFNIHSPNSINMSQLIIDSQQPQLKHSIINHKSFSIDVPAAMPCGITTPPQQISPITTTLPEPITTLNVDINHKQNIQAKDIIECKDMSPTSKVSQLQTYVNEIFDVSCVRFYSLIIDSDFWGDVSKEMGFINMNEGTWLTSKDECHQERTLTFQTPISFKIGPKIASVTQVQKIRRTSTNGYFMETSSVSKDVPYGENFSVENYISLEPEGSDKSILKVSTAVKFTKSIWGLSNIIEKTVIQSNKDFFQVWSTMAKKRIHDKQQQISLQQSIHQSIHQSSFIQTSPLSTVHQSQTIQKTKIDNSNNNNICNNNNNNNISSNNNNNSDKEFLKSMEYEDIKQLFFKLFKEVEIQQQPKVIKIISALTNQHISNLTIQFKHTVSDIIQYYIPFTLPNLHPNQYFEVFWVDKKNEFSQFFYKDLSQPIFYYVNNSDSIGICTVTEFQALKKSLSFVILESGKKASIKYNKDLDKCIPF